MYLSQAQFSGPLQKLNADTDPADAKPGAVVLITGKDRKKNRDLAFVLASSRARGVLMPVRDGSTENFERRGEEFPALPPMIAGAATPELGGAFNALELSSSAVQILAKLPDGTKLRFVAPSTKKQGSTWNAVGIIHGSDPAQQHATVLFSAHLDHLGVGKPVNGDRIYNGADDDASGVAAVLEIARVLGAEPKPKRTVIFALFGSEELGGLGSTYFREHPPVPLLDIAANLEFEMIGRPDPAVNTDTVWISGWERSNLGPTLAEHGAHLVGDPHPEQNFFARSDNYVLAKKGVVAQTISSYGMHAQYHKPDDDIAHIDFKHMTEAIGSLLAPVEWLVNSDFKPQWNPGGQP